MYSLYLPLFLQFLFDSFMDLVKGGKHSVEHAIRRPFKVPPPPKVRCHWCYYHPMGFPVGPLPAKNTVLLYPSTLSHVLAQLYYVTLLAWVIVLTYPLSPLWDMRQQQSLFIYPYNFVQHVPNSKWVLPRWAQPSQFGNSLANQSSFCQVGSRWSKATLGILFFSHNLSHQIHLHSISISGN